MSMKSLNPNVLVMNALDEEEYVKQLEITYTPPENLNGSTELICLKSIHNFRKKIDVKKHLSLIRLIIWSFFCQFFDTKYLQKHLDPIDS